MITLGGQVFIAPGCRLFDPRVEDEVRLAHEHDKLWFTEILEELA